MITKKADLIIPQVMADMISAELPAKIRFLPLVQVDTTLVNQPGDTITVPRYEYTGDAKVVAEGEPIDLKKLITSKVDAKVKKVADGFSLTDEAALSGYGDPVGTIKRQLVDTIAAGVDNDILAALAQTKLTYNTTAFTLDTIDAAVALFNDEDDDSMVLMTHPKDALALRKKVGQDWTRASELGDQILIKGTFGEILGAQVVRSKKLAEGTAYLIKQGALKLYMKRDVEVETARDIEIKATKVTADQHFTAYLYDESKAIKITVAAAK